MEVEPDRRTIPEGVTVHPRVLELLKEPYDTQRSWEWFERRRGMLTASTIADVLKDTPFKNPYSNPGALFRSKTGQSRSRGGGRATQHGVDNEELARQKYEQRTGQFCLEFGCISHPKYPWLGGSPDGITLSGRLVEIKCPYSRPIIPGEVPKYYIPQIQILMEVLDLEVCDFVQYKSGHSIWTEEVLDITEVRRDREWFAEHIGTLETFWERIQSWWDVIEQNHEMRRCLGARLIMAEIENGSDSAETIRAADEYKSFLKDEKSALAKFDMPRRRKTARRLKSKVLEESGDWGLWCEDEALVAADRAKTSSKSTVTKTETPA